MADKRARTSVSGRRAEKAFSGRLPKTERRVEEFTASLAVDRRLFAEDIAGSRAHAKMLRSIGVLTPGEHHAIDGALREIRREFERDEFEVDEADEDIHMAVERRLLEKVGDAGGKLHTARSRNDQVATDLRLWTKRACRELMVGVAELQDALLRRAREHRTTVLPGYTHMQRAQVVSLAHHFLAYVEMLQRDVERLGDCRRRTDVMPLGSGALAATTLPIDRSVVADELGFDRVSANSLDAVGDRDFAVELIGACSLLMVHLSRLAEELVLWSTAEFGFAELPDAYATGSSLMPQKKNPDVLELIRGRVGGVVGAQVALLMTLKALPLAYNRDLQEDKRSLFDAVDTTQQSVAMMAGVIRVIAFDVAAMRAAAADPALMATDVAEHLVAHGIPFREAHRIVGKAVRAASRARVGLDSLEPQTWAAIDSRVDAAIARRITTLFDPVESLQRRNVTGGPGPRAVQRELTRAATQVARTLRSGSQP
jgi:argininosuccinate lyase